MTGTWNWSLPVDLDLWIILFYVASLLIGAKIVEVVANCISRVLSATGNTASNTSNTGTPIGAPRASFWNSTECTMTNGLPCIERKPAIAEHAD